MNGKAFPSSAPLDVELGERVRVRFFNIGLTTHPIHLHGQDFLHMEQDGNPIAPDNQPLLNAIPVAPGQTQVVQFEAVNPGVWPMHCHIAHHQANNSSSGFGGMGIAIRIADQTAPGATPVARVAGTGAAPMATGGVAPVLGDAVDGGPLVDGASWSDRRWVTTG